MQKGKEFLSQLKLYTDYLKWNDEVNRYETWDEACDSVLDTHILKYGDKVQHLIDEVKPSYKSKEFLVSQRNLQWRGPQVMKNNAKLYNCCVTYAYTPDVFAKGFFVLLSGTGLGVSLKKKFVSQLPDLHPRLKGAKNFVVEDSIEGWSDAAKVLIASYCKHPSLPKEYFGYQIKFDFSNIRPEGAFITGGFGAPGPEGLKQSLERVEKLLNDYIGTNEAMPFKSIIVYDIFMHLSDAVISGGVRRSAMNVVFDEDDDEMIHAKTGNWRQETPHRARSNNSVGLIRGQFSKEKFKALVELNQGDNDVGFVFMTHEDDMFNPCFEIGFNFYSKLKQKIYAVFQFCNLDEISASACLDKNGNFVAEKFYRLCRNAAIVGTLQAGFNKFPYLGEETEEIVSGEALLGVSVTGWMDAMGLFNAEVLEKGAAIVKATNEEVAALIGINPAARSTTVKPSGNASVILMTPSGIHADHSVRYFRLMQLNKHTETAKYLAEYMPEILEESTWSATNTDYIVFVPVENHPNATFKDSIMGIKHLELIKLVKKHWVDAGATPERSYMPGTSHNVSNTVLIDNMDDILEYLFENQEHFSAVSFLAPSGDKDYSQAPFTSVLNSEELMATYGDGVIFMSGLIVDGLHYFNDDLWQAANHALKEELPITGTREQVLLKKHWLKRVKQFSKNYFNKDMKQTIYCMKDVHLWHKWNTISRTFKSVDFTKILQKPEYTSVGKLGAVACSGGACEIVRIG